MLQPVTVRGIDFANIDLQQANPNIREETAAEQTARYQAQRMKEKRPAIIVTVVVIVLLIILALMYFKSKK